MSGEKDLAKTEEPRGLVPLTRWNDYYIWPTQGGLRHLRFHQETNGFEDVFFTCGDRVLIDPPKFWESVKRQGGGG